MLFALALQDKTNVFFERMRAALVAHLADGRMGEPQIAWLGGLLALITGETYEDSKVAEMYAALGGKLADFKECLRVLFDVPLDSVPRTYWQEQAAGGRVEYPRRPTEIQADCGALVRARFAREDGGGACAMIADLFGLTPRWALAEEQGKEDVPPEPTGKDAGSAPPKKAAKAGATDKAGG